MVVAPVLLPSAEASSADEGALQRYYDTIFASMRDALAGGSRDSLRELEFLLLQHHREGMWEGARPTMEQFALLAEGLKFELDLADMCSVEILTEQPIAQASQTYLFKMRASSRGNVLEFGGEEEVVFRAFVESRDFDILGHFVESEASVLLRVDERQKLTGIETLELPFGLDGAPPDSVLRELKITVELLPCVVTLDGRKLPVSITSNRAEDPVESRQRKLRNDRQYAECCEFSTMLFPAGYESIQRAPMTTLVEALRRGGQQYARHIFLAAHFMPEEKREVAMKQLIEKIRFAGDADELVPASMGALRVLSRQDLPVTDRRAWLLWWQNREQKK